MTTIENGNGRYEVDFTHYRYYKLPTNDDGRPVEKIGSFGVLPVGGETSCIVFFTKRSWRTRLPGIKLYNSSRQKGPGCEPFHSAANCSLLDVFDVRRGELLSLARTVREIHPKDRKKREEFWATWESVQEKERK